MRRNRKKEEIRGRTAKTDFKDSCGEQIGQGDTFIIVEPRPQFYSRTWLKKALAALDEDVKDDEGGARIALLSAVLWAPPQERSTSSKIAVHTPDRPFSDSTSCGTLRP